MGVFVRRVVVKDLSGFIWCCEFSGGGDFGVDD